MKNPKDPETGLTDLEFYFAVYFLRSEKKNASEALRAAGYRVKNAGSYASRLLRKPAIRAFIDSFRVRENRLTRLKQNFVNNYLLNRLNASKALRDAGSKSRSTSAHGARLLKDPMVRREILYMLKDSM